MRQTTRAGARSATRITTKTAAAALLAAALLAGCSSTGNFGRQAVTAGPAGPSYVSGKGVQVFNATPTVMTDAKDAMTDVGIHSIHQVREPDNTDVFEGTTADNRKAQVAVQPRGSKMVVTTRIGWRGDEPLSRAVLDRINIRQGNATPSAAPARAAATGPASEPGPLPAPEADAPAPAQPGVSDAVMLRGQLESGYGQNPVP